VDITPTVSPLDRNRVDITIAVKEGKAAKIRHVNLYGDLRREDIRQLGVQGKQLVVGTAATTSTC
jgi:outer membrane protein assembly factor BamA